MFTGIVEDVGEVVSWRRTTGPKWDDPAQLVEQWELAVRPSRPDAFVDPGTSGTYVGASICVSGVCLTVTRFGDGLLWFGVAPETLRRTRWDQVLRAGGDAAATEGSSRVNLERAATANARNSGHYVQGHVDGVARVVAREVDGDSLRITFLVLDGAPVARYIVEKGFIAVDGTSLTVVHVDRAACTFSLMLVEHTQKCVVLPSKGVGDLVNVEVDVMAKYGAEHAERVSAELTRRVDVLERALLGTVAALEARVADVERALVAREPDAKRVRAE